MSRIFRTMYQVPDLGTGVEERERPWRLTLEALRHPEREEELLQQAIPLAKPSLHTYFGVENREGLAEGILERGSIQELAQSVGANGVRLISAGARSAEVDPHALVTSGRLAARISELAAGFGYVLLDAPPGLGNRVTSCLAALADGVILLVQPSFTPRQAARQAKENIEATGGRLLGVVLWRHPLLSSNQTASSQRGPKTSKKS